MSRKKLQALFNHIGGETRLQEILLRFYQKMSQDILIGYFFDGKDLSSIANRQKEFIMAAAGLLETYTGKNPTSAHLDLPPILKGHFDRRLVILEETLREFQIADQDIRSWIEFENSFRRVVVNG